MASIGKGPVLDWTDDNGLMKFYRKWRKRVEVLFKGPLNTANDAVKCNYIIYWPDEIGMDLVEKWEIEVKFHDGKRNTINRYFDLFLKNI